MIVAIRAMIVVHFVPMVRPIVILFILVRVTDTIISIVFVIRRDVRLVLVPEDVVGPDNDRGSAGEDGSRPLLELRLNARVEVHWVWGLWVLGGESLRLAGYSRGKHLMWSLV